MTLPIAMQNGIRLPVKNLPQKPTENLLVRKTQIKIQFFSPLSTFGSDEKDKIGRKKIERTQESISITNRTKLNKGRLYFTLQ